MYMQVNQSWAVDNRVVSDVGVGCYCDKLIVDSMQKETSDDD